MGIFRRNLGSFHQEVEKSGRFTQNSGEKFTPRCGNEAQDIEDKKRSKNTIKMCPSATIFRLKNQRKIKKHKTFHSYCTMKL